jgi:hypothetical protein
MCVGVAVQTDNRYIYSPFCFLQWLLHTLVNAKAPFLSIGNIGI